MFNKFKFFQALLGVAEGQILGEDRYKLSTKLWYFGSGENFETLLENLSQNFDVWYGWWMDFFF